jgi:hypothetical protein
MTKSSTPCRRAVRFGRSAGAPQNGQVVVLLVVPSGLAYLVRLPGFLSGGVTATTRLDQQLSHPLNCLVIFDLLGQASFAPSSASRFCSGLAQGIADARVHAARLPYLRLILPPRALLSLYVAANASVVKSFSTGKPRNPLSLLWSSGDGGVMPLAALMRWL